MSTVLAPTVAPAAKAATPTSAPGSNLVFSGARAKASLGRLNGRVDAGFTLVELLVVVALIAITSATISLALRDPAELQLQREAQRLAALLETARAESRASGLSVHWIPKGLKGGDDFRFEGLPKTIKLPTRWLGEPPWPCRSRTPRPSTPA